jgi:hypothetical protein
MNSIIIIHNIIIFILIIYSIFHLEQMPLYTPDGIHFAILMFLLDLVLIPLVLSIYKFDNKLFWGAMGGVLIYNISACQDPRISPIMLIISGIASLYLFNKYSTPLG